MRLLRVVLIVLFVSLTSFPAFALDSLNVEMTDVVRGFIDQGWDIEMTDTHIFLATGTTGLKILDRSDPSDLHCIGESLRNPMTRERGDFWLDKVRYHNGYLYGLYFDGTTDFSNYNLTAFDISDPGNPIELGSVFVQNLSNDICFHGDYAFISSSQVHPVHQQFGITVVDISDPNNLAEVGFVTTGNRMQNSVDISGNTLFYSAFSSVPLVVGAIDISDLNNTTELGTWEVPGDGAYLGDILVDGSNLFVLDYNFGLRVLDISNPAQIAETGSLDLDCAYPANNFGVLTKTGNQLEYVKIGRLNHLYGVAGLIDVSDPSSPQQGDTYQVDYEASGVGSLNGKFCFFGNENYMATSLHYVDLTTQNPTHHEFPVYNSPWAIAGTDEILYVGTSSGDVLLIDISDRHNSFIRGTIEGFSSVHVKYMMIADNSLFIQYDHDMEGGVKVYDISNPLNPAFLYDINDLNMMMGPVHFDLYGDLMLMACGFDGIWAFDLSGGTPQLLGNWNPNDQMPQYDINKVKVNGSYAYVVVNDQVVILDVSSPESISQHSVTSIQGYITSIDFSGENQYLVVGLGMDGVNIYDVSDPVNPVFTSSLGNEIEAAIYVVADNNMVYATDFGDISVHCYDVSDIQNPERIGYHETIGGYPWTLATIPGGFAISNVECLEVFQLMTTDAEEPIAAIPQAFKTARIYPNPFNPSTTIKVDVNRPMEMEIVVFDVAGRQVQTITKGWVTSGSKQYQFNAQHLPSGSYYVRISGAGVGQSIQKITLVK